MKRKVLKKWLPVKVSQKLPNPVSEEETEAPLGFKCDAWYFETDFLKGLRHHVQMKHRISQLDESDDTGMMKHKKRNHDIHQIDGKTIR